MRTKTVILTFEEANVPSDDYPYKYEVLLETTASTKEIDAFIRRIERVKTGIDEGKTEIQLTSRESSVHIIKIDRPADWEDLGWHRKIEYCIDKLLKEFPIGTIKEVIRYSISVA